MTAPRTYRRNGYALQMTDLRDLAPYLSKSTIQSRLEAWECGRISCDDLLRLSKGSGNASGNFEGLDCGPRRQPEDIKVSAFELRLGGEIEERNQRRR